jgi:hypothetical protein
MRVFPQVIEIAHQSHRSGRGKSSSSPSIQTSFAAIHDFYLNAFYDFFWPAPAPSIVRQKRVLMDAAGARRRTARSSTAEDHGDATLAPLGKGEKPSAAFCRSELSQAKRAKLS